MRLTGLQGIQMQGFCLDVAGDYACFTRPEMKVERVSYDVITPSAARAIFEATSRFHHPAHSEEWSDPELPARIDAVLALLLRGLEAPRKR